MRQDDGRSRPVVRVCADIRPHNQAALVDDKDGRRGQAIAQQVEYAIRIGHRVVGVGQDRIAGVDELRNGLGFVLIHVGHGQNFGVGGTEGLVVILQLDELCATCPSGLAPEEDDHHCLFALIIA